MGMTYDKTGDIYIAVKDENHKPGFIGRIFDKLYLLITKKERCYYVDCRITKVRNSKTGEITYLYKNMGEFKLDTLIKRIKEAL